MLHKRLGITLAGVLCSCTPLLASAHGFAGKRFFPSTLAVPNPFVSDELGLQLQRMPEAQDQPLTSHSRQAGLSSAALYFSKRLTQRLQVSIADNYTYSNFRNGRMQNGLGDVVLGARLQGPVRAGAEAVVSAGLNVKIGGSGSHSLNNDSYTTLSPTFYFGKGFGNLPTGLKYLRPMALTGDIAYNYPTRGSAPQTLNTGFTLQYSLQYLQSMMKNGHIPPVLRNLTPVVEFPFQVGLSNGYSGVLAGTVNPGVIWATQYGQIGMEAALPVDNRSGRGVGGLLQFRAYLGQIFPHIMGTPPFGQIMNKPIDLEN